MRFYKRKRKGDFKIKVKLKSDFLDYYDHHFDLEGETFNRFTYEGMNRIEMFRYFKTLGLTTPPFATVQKLYELYFLCVPMYDVVVYLDLHSHRGENKEKLPLIKAIEKYPDNWASIYIPNSEIGSLSWRYLQIGKKIFWLKYRSNDWRSNYGDVDIRFFRQEEDGYHPQISLPLFAIDFIYANVAHSNTGKTYAVDFNIAPQIKGTEIERILTPKQTAGSIKEAFIYYRGG